MYATVCSYEGVNNMLLHSYLPPPLPIPSPPPPPLPLPPLPLNIIMQTIQISLYLLLLPFLSLPQSLHPSPPFSSFYFHGFPKFSSPPFFCSSNSSSSLLLFLQLPLPPSSFLFPFPSLPNQMIQLRLHRAGPQSDFPLQSINFEKEKKL